jgi:hypothetical protein
MPATEQQNMRRTSRLIFCATARIFRGPENRETLAVPEALFCRESVPRSMRGCMENMANKQHHLWVRPCTAAHFCGANTHIGPFEEPKIKGHGAPRSAVADVDLGRRWQFQ